MKTWFRPYSMRLAVVRLLTVPTCAYMSSSSSCRLVYGRDDALFGSIERQQGDRPFGKVLDAGTGLHSLRWIATLDQKGMTNFTAITADENMRRSCQRELEELNVTNGNLLIGNWFDDRDPLHLNETYDVIFADYLIGAMDGFSPYKQDLMLQKLVQYLKPNGRLYVVGLQPIPDKVDDPDANIICQVRQVRDACILLAGHRCYREYPYEWVERQIQSHCPELKLLQTSRFPILYRQSTIHKQIKVARNKLPYFIDTQLAGAMSKVLDDLETKTTEACERRSRIPLGFDYIVTAEKTTE